MYHPETLLQLTAYVSLCVMTLLWPFSAFFLAILLLSHSFWMSPC